MTKDIQILSYDSDGNAVYSFSKGPTTVINRNRLIQQLVYLFFTAKGSNILSPTAGSTSLFLTLLSNNNSDRFRQIIPIVLKDIKEQVIKKQVTELLDDAGALSAEETLVDLRLKDLKYIENENMWEVYVTVETAAGSFNLNIS